MIPDDELSKVPISEYLASHAKHGGKKTWSEFFHSNLFAALTIWILSQSVIVGGLLISYWTKTTQLTEWKGQTDATIKRMDEQGTNASRWRMEEQNKQISNLDIRLKNMEAETGHLDVLESEHRRLTKDVEDLKDARDRPKK